MIGLKKPSLGGTQFRMPSAKPRINTQRGMPKIRINKGLASQKYLRIKI